MANSQWVRVTKKSPCQVCKKTNWCSVSADGAVAKCMRVQDGCYRSKADSKGASYYLHRLADGPRPRTVAPPRPDGPAADRADADTLHEIYSALLARLTLSKAHRENLERRGLTGETIDRNAYKTLPVQDRYRIVRELRDCFGDRVLHVPGIVTKEGNNGPYLTLRGPAGLIVPCRDRAGQIVALKVRRDDGEKGRDADEQDGSRYFYISSAGQGGPGPGAPVHVPYGTPTAVELVRLIEGELKADILFARTGLPTVSVPGATNWLPALDVLGAIGGRTVRLAFDMDCWRNLAVARALSECTDALVAAGYTVELERWDAADGKGLDDLLAAGKSAELLQGDAALHAVKDILAAATADEESAEPDELSAAPDELSRMQEVLESGGAEALFRDHALLQALADQSTVDPAAYAAVRASIRKRVSLRDLDKALAPLRRHQAAGDGEESPVYFEHAGCIYRNVQTREGPVTLSLSNFSARIVEDVEHDDGAEKTRFLVLQGTLVDGSPLPRAEVPAAEFDYMKWIVPAWGTRAVVYAGIGTKDHLRTALQLLSVDVPRRTIYRHIGWRKIGEAWVYLHAGGAVGADGLSVDISVVLPDALSGYLLPAPPSGAALVDAVRASLGLLRLGQDRATFPPLASIYRAVLGDTDFSLHLSGPTGNYKSEVAALAQQHFGPDMDARHLPANWSSTGNSLEALAFAAKDAILVVDDFCPTGSTADVQRYHKEADRLFRGQGNRSGRQRMKADGGLRPTKPPRGLTVSTGEDTPRGQSLRARLLVEEISPGDFGPPPPAPNPTLTACQHDAAEGKYAAALSGFICWLAPQYDAVRGRLRGEAASLRDAFRADGMHARTPGIVADLALGLRYLLEYAVFAGAVTDAERAELWQRGLKALADAASAQAAQIATAEPAGLFLRLLAAALASGYAHVADKDGNEPREPQRWGWRPEEFYVGNDHKDTRYKPQGTRVGWLVDGELYLEPEASFAVVQRLARDQNESFPISAITLRRRLKEKGLLAATDEKRGKLTVRMTLQGARREVLHIAFTPTAVAAQSGTTSSAAEGKIGPETRSSLWAGNGETIREPAHAIPAVAGADAASGRLGRSDAREAGSAGADCKSGNVEDWGEV